MAKNCHASTRTVCDPEIFKHIAAVVLLGVELFTPLGKFNWWHISTHNLAVVSRQTPQLAQCVQCITGPWLVMITYLPAVSIRSRLTEAEVSID